MITKRNITPKRDQEVKERDGWRCIIPNCECTTLDKSHHAYYGGQANRKENRNDIDQLVTLCIHHHDQLHFREGGQELREFCIQYLKSIYEN